MSEKLFSVGNHHSKDGSLPTHYEDGTSFRRFDGDDGNYYSYFQNQSGDQWIFLYHRKEDMVYIQSGDLEWTTVLGLQHLKEYIFDVAEMLWLDACIRAIGAGKLSDYMKRQGGKLLDARHSRTQDKRS